MGDMEVEQQVPDSELRSRIRQTSSKLPDAGTEKSTKRVVIESDKADEAEDVDEKKHSEKGAKKTYGRTPDGKVFTVPQTHDMVSQLLSPTQPKNLSDIFVLLILAVHISGLFYLPKQLRIPVLGSAFVFWRTSYNAGIGYLLQIQSADRRLVHWARKSRIFELPSSGNNPHPWLYALLKRELEIKIPEDYEIEEAPVEYNTWLVFRRVVDLILMCDFVSYVLFAIACIKLPSDEIIPMTITRYFIGLGLIIFNLWVKLDAHRVVKDYAWYWGDFFFLIDQELTFDGVFEMAPHPMYSVGYAGYYGISLIAASYKVLFISLLAHAAQFAFLILVENPHIQKTYNSPPRKRVDVSSTDTGSTGEVPPELEPYMDAAPHPAVAHNILGINNTDMHRVIDISVFLLRAHVALLAIFIPSTAFYKLFFVMFAAFWRFWYTVGIGFILNRQSNKKTWTRHFIKYGDNTEEAWRQWKGVYHISMNMCYASYVAAAWKMYNLPPDWSYGMVLLRHVIGTALISLHLWTVVSIYDSLGEFGWFYGDFFFDHGPKLTYSGIYRFLNNPERFLGLAGLWGFALITYSRAMFLLALWSHLLTIAFIQFVERPHMQKLYGESLREQSGLSKSIRRSLPPSIRQWQVGVDRHIEATADFIEEFIEAAKPKLAAGVGTIVRDATALFKNYPARISITRVADDLAGFDPKDYSISIEGTPSSGLAELDRRSGREGENGRQPPEQRSNFKTLMYEYGAPIKVKWTAPVNHDKKDWIALYMVSDNASREATSVASRGRWIATNKDQYDTVRAEEGILLSDVPVAAKEVGDKDLVTGEMVFEKDKLWWTTGVFEFRYHHAGKHNVMAISLPFEIRIGKFDENDIELDANGGFRAAVEQALLPVVRNCFDRDPEIAPRNVDELFGSLVERDDKYAKRVVFALHQMFGVEFAPEVVQADGNVKNLAWRICNAKKVLAPYSLSSSTGRSTPGGTKY